MEYTLPLMLGSPLTASRGGGSLFGRGDEVCSSSQSNDDCRDAAGGEGAVCVASWGYKELPLKERSNGTNDNIEGARLMSCIQMTEGDDT